MTSLRFPATERLKSRKAFIQLYRQGRSFAGTWVTLYVVPCQQGKRHIGFVCSKKQFRQSVQRNRIKRRLRECYRLNRAALKEGMDLVVIADNPMKQEPPFQALMRDFLSVCEKAQVLK